MEGVNILVESTTTVEPLWLGAVYLGTIIAGILMICYIIDEVPILAFLTGIIFTVGFIFIILAENKIIDIEKTTKTYVVTPTRESYHIDLSRYEVLKIEQKLITIKEKVE